MDDGGQPIRGAITTVPAGREERFLPFVAGGVVAWTHACIVKGAANGSPTNLRLSFSFDTDGAGKMQNATAADASDQARCLAIHASAADATSLPPSTHVTVQLARDEGGQR